MRFGRAHYLQGELKRHTAEYKEYEAIQRNREKGAARAKEDA